MDSVYFTITTYNQHVTFREETPTFSCTGQSDAYLKSWFRLL